MTGHGRLLGHILVNPEIVRNGLESLKKSSSPGVDTVHPFILQEARNELVQPLTRLFQLSLDQGRIPQEWKLANVTPIFKKGNRSDPGNYCPISLT